MAHRIVPRPRREHPDTPWITRSSLVALLVAFISALAFAYLGSEVGEPWITTTDRNFLRDVLGWTQTWPLAAVKAVTFLGTAPVIVAITLVVIALLARSRRWPDAALLIVAAVGAILLSTATKRVVGRVRPVEFFRTYAPPNSYPSGHTLNAASLALAVSFVLWRSPLDRRVKLAGSAALALYAACVGASRIVLGVHYATDVLGGYLLAIAWVALLATLLHSVQGWQRRKRGRQPTTQR